MSAIPFIGNATRALNDGERIPDVMIELGNEDDPLLRPLVLLIQGDRRDIKEKKKRSKDGDCQIVEDGSRGWNAEFEKQEMDSETEEKKSTADHESRSDPVAGHPVRKRLFEKHRYHPTEISNYTPFTRKR